MSKRPVPWIPVRLIGKGGMGEVWAARHKRTRDQAALKVITGLRAEDEWARISLHNEVRAMARLSHPAIVRILDHGRVPEGGQEHHTGQPCIVMERVDGGSLIPLLGRIAWPEVRALLFRLLRALAHAHAMGLIHRDLKPGNVLVPAQHGPRGAKLTDFGLTHPVHDRHSQPLNARVGTPSYMAPEQIEGAWRTFGAPTDLYGLGCVAWALVTGRPPFTGQQEAMLTAHRLQAPPRLQPRRDTPPAFEDWLRWLLAKSPADRPQHAMDAARALWQLDDEHTDAVGIGVPRGWPQPPARQGPPLESLFALRAMPVVGRSTLQATLWSKLRRCVRQGGTHTIVLSGSAGTGKSHLARWLCEAAAETGCVRTLHVPHSDPAGPLDGLAASLRRHLGTAGVAPERVPDLLARVLPPRVLGRPERATVFHRALVDPEVEGSAAATRSGAEKQHDILEVLEHLAADRPLVIWLDDLQWAEGSVGALSHLVGREPGEGPPILILATVALTGRDPGPWVQAALRALPTQPRVDICHVGPLGTEGRRALVRQLLGLAPALSARVEDRTAGNPLFAVQLIGDWVSRGLLMPSGDGLRLRPGANTRLPDSLYEVWSAPLEEALAGLPQSARLGLELAALQGVEVDTAEWKALCRAVGVQGELDAVERLLDRRLAVAGPEGPGRHWSFVHGMLREVLVQQAWAAGRAVLWHLAAAMFLEGRTSCRNKTRRARHLLAAGGVAEALPALREAARAQWESGDRRLAEGLIDQWRKGLIDLQIPQGDPQWGEQALMQCGLLRHRGDLRTASQIMKRALDAARRHRWRPLIPQLLIEAGDVERLQGRLAQADAYLAHAESAAEAIEDPVAAARATQKRAVVAAGFGQHQDAIQLADASRHALQQAGCQVDAAVSLLIRSEALLALGRRSQARAGLIQASGEYARHGCRWGVADVAAALAWLDREEGDLDSATAHADEAIALLESLHSASVDVARLHRAFIRLDRRQYDDAEVDLSALWRHFDAEGLDSRRGQARVGLILCDAGRGRWRDLNEQLSAAERELPEVLRPDASLVALLERAVRCCETAGRDTAVPRLEALKAHFELPELAQALTS